jgi:serine/threonine protein kinase
MAEVFLAVHRGLGGYEKRLVIKRVLPELTADEHFLRMFFDEAKLHVQLSHGNLVPIFDFGRVGNDYFLAMEYIEGSDLRALLREAGRTGLGVECAVLVGQELSRALAHVHRNKLVHRDLTPRNVLISLDGEVKLADFGVARPAGQAKGVSGTIAYMSPEQARGDEVDGRSDLYSLGLVLAELVTGALPRPANIDSEAGLALASEAGRVVIDGPLGPLIGRVTDPDPAGRYADAVEMGAALDELARSLGASRASAAHELAERARRAHAEGSENLPAATGIEGPATYFRGAATQVSIVDIILAPPEPASSRRRPRWWLAGPLALAAIAGAWVIRAGNKTPAQTPPPIAPLPSRTAKQPSTLTLEIDHAPTLADPPSVTPEQSARVPRARPAAPAVRPHAPPPPPASAAAPTPAVVRLVCSPWCFVDVDGRRQGEDGRAHTLHLAPGHHRVVAHRLEDQKERLLDLTAGQAIDLAVTFD